MLKILQSVFLTAFYVQIVEAHVRALPTGFGCRNCNGNASPGPFCNNGPLSGRYKFGKNGVNKVNEGQIVKLAISYNGNHQDKKKNFFHVRYVCGSGVNDEDKFKRIGPQEKDVINCKPPCIQLKADEIVSVDGQPVTTANYPIDATRSSRHGNSISFKIPDMSTVKSGGAEDLSKCTFALVEGRDWGVAWDFDINAGPPPEAHPLQRSISGTYLFNNATGCVKDSPDCECLTGHVMVDHRAGERTAKALVSIMDYPNKIIEIRENPKVPGALSAQYILSNCERQVDQLVGFNLSPLGNKEGYLNVANIDEEPRYCGAILKAQNTPTTLKPPPAISSCAGCKDVPQWLDKDGHACSVYKSCLNGDWRTREVEYYQTYQGDLNLTALDACCRCGGGQGRFGRPTTTTTTTTTTPTSTTTTPDPCAGVDCGENGRCFCNEAQNGMCGAGWSCYCANGFTGARCEISPPDAVDNVADSDLTPMVTLTAGSALAMVLVAFLSTC